MSDRVIIACLVTAVVFVIVTCEYIADRRLKQLLAKAKAEREQLNAALDPLEELMRQERIKQAVPLVTLVAVNLPVDVVSVTLITHYADGCNLALDCGRPERIEAPKEF